MAIDREAIDAVSVSVQSARRQLKLRLFVWWFICSRIRQASTLARVIEGQIIADGVRDPNGRIPASPRRSGRICIVASICSPWIHISALVELNLPLFTVFCVCLS
jgi:hypothetical protein